MNKIATKFDGTVAKFVLEFRNRNDLTQADLADRLGVHPQYVSNVERGVHKAPVTFCALMIPLLRPRDVKFLTDMVNEETHQKIFNKIQSTLSKQSKKRRKKLK